MSVETQDLVAQGKNLANMGFAYTALGQHEKALGYLEQALAVSVKIHNRQMEGRVLDMIAGVYSKLGQPQKASSYHERAISTMKQQEPAR